MRPPPRSDGTLPNRPRPAEVVRPVYEDFRPMTEWQQDDESNILLLIYLPGFQREHLKVSTEGRNLVRARGERLVAGNKWSRFQEDYPLPEDCNIRGIRAKFEGGILTITIPRKTEAKYTFKEAAKATEDTHKPSQKTQEDLSSQRQPSPPKAAVENAHQKAADDNSGSSVISSLSAPEKGRDGKIRETPPDQKMMSEKPEKSPNEKPEKSKEQSDYRKSAPKTGKHAGPAEDALKETIEESKAQKEKGGSAYEDFRPLKAEKPEKSEEERDSKYVPKISGKVPSILGKVMEKSEEEIDNRKSTARKIEKVPNHVDISRETTEKPKSQKDKVKTEPKKKKTTTAAASSRTDYGLANYKQAVKNLDLNEDRQLLVNVGAAVLVLIAIGAYLSYIYISGEDT